jgi:hypothetical protein
LHRLFARIRGFCRAAIILHVASRLKPVMPFEGWKAWFADMRSTGLTRSVDNSREQCAQRDNFLADFAPALALLQHSARDRAFEGGHRLYFGGRKVKIFSGKDPVNYRLRAIWTN